MNLAAPFHLVELPGTLTVWLALVSPFVALEVQIGVGVFLTVIGTILQWQLPRRRMSFEERMKDGKLTEAQAARALRVHSVLAPFVTVAGAITLIAAFLVYTS